MTAPVSATTRAAARVALAQRQATRNALVDAARPIPAQYAALMEPAHLVAFFCTRRAGKSYAIGLKLFLTALSFAGCSCLYMGLTQDSAVAVMNKDILEVINNRFGIGARYNVSGKRWELPNGSIIYLRGADANSHEMAKILGQKYRLAVLDEVGKYRNNVEQMVYGDLLPAMGDDVGTIILSGVPSNITAGLFYKVTNGLEPGWSVHRWTWRDNVHRRDNLKQLHDELLEKNPLRVKTPSYRQEWLGEWVIDEGALVYRFDAERNLAASLPPITVFGDKYHYLLGIDLGYVDATALVVIAYSEHDPVLYVVSAVKYEGIILDTLAGIVKGLWRRPENPTGAYAFEAMVVDAASLQSVEELRQRCGLPLTNAKKVDKRAAIEMINSDFHTARIKLLPECAYRAHPKQKSLVDELDELIWDEKQLAAVPKRFLEDPRCENHACDALNYVWRYARHYDATKAEESQPDERLRPDFPERHLAQQIAARNAMHDSSRGWPGAIRVDPRGPASTGRFGR